MSYEECLSAEANDSAFVWCKGTAYKIADYQPGQGWAIIGKLKDLRFCNSWNEYYACGKHDTTD